MSQLTVSTVPSESESHLGPQYHPAGVPVWHEVRHEDAAGMQLMEKPCGLQTLVDMLLFAQ